MLAQAVQEHPPHKSFVYSQNVFRGNKDLNLQVILNILKERNLNKLVVESFLFFFNNNA